MWHFTELIGAHTLKNWFVPALEVNFLKRLPQLVALQIFQSSHFSHGESLNHNILSSLDSCWTYFWKHIYTTKMIPNSVAKILAVKFAFAPDWLWVLRWLNFIFRIRNFLDYLKDCLATRMRQKVHFMNLFKSLADIVGLKFRWVFCCNWIFIILQMVVWSQCCRHSLTHHGRDWQITIPLHEIPALDLCL